MRYDGPSLPPLPLRHGGARESRVAGTGIGPCRSVPAGPLANGRGDGA